MDNPCESRGECFEKNGKWQCRCHAWWEGTRCERRMMHIPYKPLSERMLQEPFWLGLITVFVVLAFIGLIWCAKRHFPEKIEKLLAEEADRNRRKNEPHYCLLLLLWYYMINWMLTVSIQSSYWLTASFTQSSQSSIVTRAITFYDNEFSTAVNSDDTGNGTHNIWQIGYTKTINFEPQPQQSTCKCRGGNR